MRTESAANLALAPAAAVARMAEAYREYAARHGEAHITLEAGASSELLVLEQPLGYDPRNNVGTRVAGRE